MSCLVSIVVISHNYDKYLRESIDSALAQDYRSLQVLVVDDGSTDSSPDIISGYGDRVESVFKPNGGYSTAINAGFAQCRGDIVMFLDADDFLYPQAVSRVVNAWDDTCAKVVFRLSLVDADGVRRGVEPPTRVRLPSGDVVAEVASRGHYVGCLIGASAFRRAVLDQLLPIPHDPLFVNNGDGYLNPLCAFFGPIASIDEELGAYRLHGGNQWAYTGEIDVQSVRQRIGHELLRERYIRDAADRRGRALPPSLMLRNSGHIVYRLTSLKLEPESHLETGDSIWRLLLALPGALGRNPELDPLDKAFTLFSGALITLLPRRLAPLPVGWILASRPRPRWLRATARLIRELPGLRRS
jgi:glycosyltransferase involved in cell wall biosynthesis